MENSGGIGASLAGRYAIALFELAREGKPVLSDAAGGVEGAIDAVSASLDTIKRALAESADFAELTTSPLLGREQATRAVMAAAGSMGVDQTTTNFLGVLARNRRLSQLPAIMRAYRELAARHRGELTAQVTSAHPLDADQLAAVKANLRTRLGSEVAVETAVNPDLLGGLVVKIGSQMIDGSIRTKLNTLAQAMKG